MIRRDQGPSRRAGASEAKGGRPGADTALTATFRAAHNAATTTTASGCRSTQPLFPRRVPCLEGATRLQWSGAAGVKVFDLATTDTSGEPWRKRLHIPAYQVGEAARYAQISAQTVLAWHKADARRLLSEKADRERLSYLQLIEVAVVAAFRKAKIPLPAIRAARDYMMVELNSRHPFAEFQFKRYGKSLFAEYKGGGRTELLKVTQAGQLAWQEIVGPLLQEFEYEHEGVAIRWHVAGASSPIIIDPRLSFGAPTVKGVPTWILKGRYDAGENDSMIAEDFGIDVRSVREALRFEGVLPGQKRKWLH